MSNRWASSTLQLFAAQITGEEINFVGGQQRLLVWTAFAEGGHTVVGVAVKRFMRWVGDEPNEPVFRTPAGKVGRRSEVALIAEFVAIDAGIAVEGFTERLAALGECAVLLGFLVGVGLRGQRRF